VGSFLGSQKFFCGFFRPISKLSKRKQGVVETMSENGMPRRSVINRVAEENNLSKVEAERIVRSVLSAVAKELADRGRFYVAEIGSILVAERAPRRYFDPRTKKDAVSTGDVSLKINISKAMRRLLEK